jgi:Lysylphosphatidylglycerol synthase TM region
MSEPLDRAEPAVPMGAPPPNPAVPMGAPPPSPQATPSAWWRRALPFAVALAFLGVTLHRIKLRAFARDVSAVNAPAFLLFALVFVVALLTADALATTIVYRRTVAPVKFREFWILRGASYLPSILNHHVGQAFLTYYVARAHGVSLARMAGGTLLVYVSWMGCLLGAACIAMVSAGLPLLTPALAFGAGILYLAVIAWRPAALARTKLLAPLFEAGLVGHLVALAVRIPHFLVLFLGTWLPFSFFGVNIPPREALIYIPILMVVITLPIAPQGMGTRDLFVATYLEAFAPGATHQERLTALAAATTSWLVAFTLVEGLLGLFLLRRALPTIEARGRAA